MKRFVCTLSVCVILTATQFTATQCARCQETQDAKPGQDVAAQSLTDQIKENPDDTKVFNKYMIKNLGEVQAAVRNDPDAAEKQLAAMKEVIDSLEPKTEPGKKLVERAVQVIDYFGTQVALGRVTLDELAAKLKEKSDDTKSITMYQSKLLMEIMPLTRTEPDEAEKLLNAAKKLLTAVKASAEQDETKQAVEGVERSFERLEQQIEMGKKLAALVGADAAPLEVEAWVNGDPLTNDDLKGKVVLLDFWAVWCGPCVATFPHLREWHEKYADKGLEIIGLTRYYNYTWDEEAGRAVRASGATKVTPEQEREMLTKFAEQNDLHHRFGIQTGSTMSDYYAVTGIPHVVVIDRQGKVRLFRIGSGEENAKAVSEMIEKCIAEG